MPTADGSNTLRHTALGELYHSDRGAVGESLHVFIEAGLDYVASHKKKIRIFEAGLGSGLNAWLTLEKSAGAGTCIDYHAIELYPLDVETAVNLGYSDDGKFRRLHESSWETTVGIADGFSLTKYHAALESFDFTKFSVTFDLIYFDAFSPDVQPRLWSVGIMEKMAGILACGGVLVTYSAKGSVKEALRAAGFSIERLPGALGKRHMIRAVKNP